LGLSLIACGEKPEEEEEDTASEPSAEDTSTEDTSTDDTGTAYTISPDSVLFSFMNGYEANDITGVMFEGATEAFAGSFTIILYDSAMGDYCAIDWTFDENSTEPDEDYADGRVMDAFNQAEMEAWYGFIATSSPETRGSCDSLDAGYADLYAAMLADQLGFGYGPLTADLQGSMETEHPAGWATVSPVVFTGIASLTSASQGGTRAYYPVNEGYAYAITDGVPAWNPSVQELPQGTEMAIEDVPFADGFYYGSYYFGLSFQ
jgi:hypothetical protein